MTRFKGVYEHIKSGKLYKLIGLARNVNNPLIEVVIYKQLYNSVLKDTNIPLSKGSIWVRERCDFFDTKKFRKIK